MQRSAVIEVVDWLACTVFAVLIAASKDETSVKWYSIAYHDFSSGHERTKKLFLAIYRHLMRCDSGIWYLTINNLLLSAIYAAESYHSTYLTLPDISSLFQVYLWLCASSCRFYPYCGCDRSATGALKPFRKWSISACVTAHTVTFDNLKRHQWLLWRDSWDPHC